MGSWTQVAVCLNCKQIAADHVPFGLLSHVFAEVCPHCGYKKVLWVGRSLGLQENGWRVVTARKVRDGWFKSHWELQEPIAVVEDNKELKPTPPCSKCGFDGVAVACVWAGEEGCQLPSP